MNAEDKEGWTPLHEAALRGQKEIAEFLIANDAEVNVMDHREFTPLNMATLKGYKEIADLLNKHEVKTGKN